MKGLILNFEFHEMGPSETLKSLDCVGVNVITFLLVLR